ncbi:PKD domain-containing protein [Paraflavitalea soli]|uniref:PKD domain-containing protein n=1 Tax=Paraflavitalea soli TaxID=2315862 RepID=A0A3B7MVV5_9BACT|nr:PKD domain-containing protein [Paraflavitalea soli]AXY77553.1 PKD domain-containing protein [Paraflavitalea soli]
MAKKLLLILLLHTVTQWARAQAPVADFSANVVSGCSPLTVTFKDQSTGNPLFWNWDFGGGNLSNLQNPTISFGTPGTYTVALVVRNADGTNGITKTNYITVYPSPRINFSANFTTSCVPATIQFTDLTDPVAGNIVSWEWDFGDGGTSTQKNPSHQYTTTGFYSVTLKAVSSTGCQAQTSFIRYIRIVPGVIPDFSFNAPATCKPPFAVNFTNLTSGPGNLTYQWNFGNSTGSTQDNPTATYSATGPYTVTLNATSEFGCTGSIQKPIDISGTGTFFTSPDTVCLNTTVNFQNASTSTPLSTLWDFGNGQQSTNLNDASTYTAPGIYTVKLKNTYTNCLDSFSKPLVVVDKPIVAFSAPVTTACKAPLTVNFQDNSPDATGWQWDFGDGNTSTQQNPSHTYTAEGQYSVTLTITSRLGCSNTLTQPAFVRIIKPTVSFANAPAGGCIPYTFAPTANTVAIDGVASYFWEYGDGFTATTTVPTGPAHTYTLAGNYTIKLTITTRGGCTESAELVNGIRTGIPPVSNFTLTPTDACASDAINFTDLSTVTLPAVVDEWLWDFGDGETSDVQNPAHTYADSGYFSVTLTAYNNKCPTVSAAQVVHIKPPIAQFIYDVACPNGLLVNFTNQSKVNAAVYGPVTYTWDFGDGGTSTLQTPPPHTYAAVGTYTVKLTVTSTAPGGCSHTISQDIQLVGEVADFTVSNPTPCKNELLQVVAKGIAANITQYEWSVNGAAFSIGARDINLRFSNAGVYSIALRITDINGCTNTKTVTNAITVSGPVANFTPAKQGGCTNTSITFNDLSTGTGINSWQFDFGDGQTQTFTAPPFAHNYTDTGSYVVKLTVTDGNGCPDTYTATDTVFITKPVAGFTSDFTTICPNTDLPFKDTSSGRGLSWQWDFGDGGTSTIQAPLHRYMAFTGTYGVKLVVTDAFGCKDSVTKANYITIKKPVPAFTALDTSSICPLLETKFTFGGSDYESFYWDFGDGSISTLPNPNHFYNTYGSYEAKLYVIGYGGCIDSVSDTINVYNPYTTSELNYSPITNCNALMVDFSLITPSATRFSFYFGDGAIDDSQLKVFQHYYKSPGFYAPSILLQDSLGCQVTVGGPNTIRILGATPLFGMDKKTFCDSGTVIFTDYTQGNDPITSLSYDFDDGTTSTDKDLTHRFTQPGTYVVKHIVSTQAGCTNTLTDTVRVYGTPHPVIISDTVVCINEVLPLQGTLTVPDTAITWKWDLGSNGQSADQNTSVKYPQSGTYAVSLESANKLGCKDKTSKNIYVPPTPTINLSGSPTVVVGTGIPMPVTYSANVATYAWTPARNLSCTDCAIPFADPRFTTTYNVRVEDIYGCPATQDITITVICNSSNYFVPNTFSPNGDGHNDVFMPRGRNIDRVNRMQVFNRWGEMVFEKKNFMVNDASAGWNGTYKGKPAAADVYVYVVEFVCDNASVVPFRGNVTLLR